MRLYNIGRAALKRIGGTSQSTNKALRSIWCLHRVAPTQTSQSAQCLPQITSAVHRSYATATKAAPKSKPKAKIAAKPKAKPKAKSAVKKTAKKPLKKKPVKKKVAAKKPKAKPLTDEQKQKIEIKKLKGKALLDSPKQKPATAWAILFSEGQSSSTKLQGVKAVTSELAARYKAFSPAELESYNHIANQNKAANAAAFRQWVESHTPADIKIANNARLQLKRKLNLSGSKYPIIQDSRIPTRPAQPRLHFFKERYSTGDFQGIKFGEATKLIQKEWEELPASEKKIYEERALADKQRYVQEFKTVFNRESTAKL